MNTHSSDHAVIILELNFDNSALFSDLHSSLILLKHQMIIILIITEQKQSADNYIANKTSTFQVRILIDDMSLKKTIIIFRFMYFIFKFNVQIFDF